MPMKWPLAFLVLAIIVGAFGFKTGTPFGMPEVMFLILFAFFMASIIVGMVRDRS